MTALATDKESALDERLRALGSLVVAFSGGVDSAYLAVRAHLVLGARALAVTADSASLAEAQRTSARDLAQRFGFAHRVIQTREFEDPAYLKNASDRCYHCKSELFRQLLPLAESLGFAHVAYGLIADDLSDFRPGHRAAAEAGVQSPLADALMTKDDVRALSRALDLPTWDQASSPCLSSRIPYGTAVTPEALRRVESAEEALRALGFRELRVRDLGETARIEIAPKEMPRLADAALAEAAVAAVLKAGYRHAALDREGYRRGRLNEALRVIPAPLV
jgi:pyridinium-3,5-biscarboxylic acid mononucleotide sulfurtransferase